MTVFEVTAVFPDCNKPLDIKGGYQTAHEFKKSIMDTLIILKIKMQLLLVVVHVHLLLPFKRLG